MIGKLAGVIRWSLFFAMAPGLSVSVAAEAQQAWRRVDVPQTVTVDEKLQRTPDGWRSASDDRPHVLASIGFFEGPPEDHASLDHDAETRRKGLVVRSWRFADAQGKGVWLVLGYADTAIMLSRRLPEKSIECQVEFDPGVTISGFEQIKSIRCR